MLSNIAQAVVRDDDAVYIFDPILEVFQDAIFEAGVDVDRIFVVNSHHLLLERMKGTRQNPCLLGCANTGQAD